MAYPTSNLAYEDRQVEEPPQARGVAGSANMSLINVLLDAFAQDMGRRLDAVEGHIIDRTGRVEQALADVDKRWETVRQACSAMPDHIERLEQSFQLQLDKFKYTVEGTYWQVEQLTSQQQKIVTSSSLRQENTNHSKTVSEAPSFGENHPFSHGHAADELDAIRPQIQSEPLDQEWMSHIERHLQQIHGVLEEMTLQHTNLQVKMNTVHNKVADTHSKVIENPPHKVLPSIAGPVSATVKAALKGPPGSPNAKTENTDAAPDPPKKEPSHDLIHAFHGAMGHKKRLRKPHKPEGREHFQEIVNSRWFEFLSALSILINAVLIGVEQHFDVVYVLETKLYNEGTIDFQPEETSRTIFRFLDGVFIIFWSIEVILNFFAQHHHYFELHNPMFRWNMFDIFCVIVSIVQLLVDTLAAELKAAAYGLAVLRVMRVARVVRVLRVVKVVKAFQGVRKLVIAVHGALLTLFWALVLLGSILFMFTIVISCGLSNHFDLLDVPTSNSTALEIGTDGATYMEEIDFYYGGIPATMATLFQAVTGGDWTVMALPIFRLSWMFHCVWYAYIAFVLFGLLNVFTGIFVESATNAANSDREIKIQAQMEEEDSYLNEIRKIFSRSDSDNSGSMTQSELERLMEQADFKQQLECLGIHPTEAHGLFKLLDDDGSGLVSIEEFLSGCIRLKGTAKSVDMITLLFETNKMKRRIEDVRRMVAAVSGLDADFSPTTSRAPSEDGRSSSPTPGRPGPHSDLASTISF